MSRQDFREHKEQQGSSNDRHTRVDHDEFGRDSEPPSSSSSSCHRDHVCEYRDEFGRDTEPTSSSSFSSHRDHGYRDEFGGEALNSQNAGPPHPLAASDPSSSSWRDASRNGNYSHNRSNSSSEHDNHCGRHEGENFNDRRKDRGHSQKKQPASAAARVIDHVHWDKPESNPHVFQVLGQNIYTSRSDLPFFRELLPEHPAAPYRRRKHEDKTVIHWGQRKLLLSEMEFLLSYGCEENPVVYAGAAPGTHVAYLADCFPKHTFFLYDPAPFNVPFRNNIIKSQELFTDEIALSFRGRFPLFICDIRASDCRNSAADDVEMQVSMDMEDQQRWHVIMEPRASMLKFRLPWIPGRTTYLVGKIYLPIYGPVTTTESRLMVDCKRGRARITTQAGADTRAYFRRPEEAQSTKEKKATVFVKTSVLVNYVAIPEPHAEKLTGDHGVPMTAEDNNDAMIDESKILAKSEPELMPTAVADQQEDEEEDVGTFEHQYKEYDNKLYWEQCFFHNTVRRVGLFPHNVQGEGLDHCYDCRSEIHVLEQYCRQVLGLQDQVIIDEHIGQMSKSISRKITSKRTLMTLNSDPGLRSKGIKKRQNINNQLAYKVAHENRKKQKRKLNDATASPLKLIDLKRKRDDDDVDDDVVGYEKQRSIGEDLMAQMGYSGRGLGKHREGIVEPVTANKRQKLTGLGFDMQKHSVAVLDSKFNGGRVSEESSVGEVMEQLSVPIPTVFAKPMSLNLNELTLQGKQEIPSSSGWKRAWTVEGQYFYIHEKTQEARVYPPLISGWSIVQQQKDDQYKYLNTLTNVFSYDVPEPED